MEKIIALCVTALLLGLGYVTYDQYKIYTKRVAYNDCIQQEQKNYENNWNLTCKNLGKKKNCELPAFLANDITKDKQEGLNMCSDRVKNVL